MKAHYNYLSHYTPSTATQLKDSHNAHQKTQERLAEVTKERDFLKTVADYLITGWMLDNGWESSEITQDAIDQQLVAVYNHLTDTKVHSQLCILRTLKEDEEWWCCCGSENLLGDSDD